VLYDIKLAKNSMVGGALAATSLDLVSVAAKPPKPLNQMAVTQSM